MPDCNAQLRCGSLVVILFTLAITLGGGELSFLKVPMSTIKLTELAEELQTCPICNRFSCYINGKNGCQFHGEFCGFLKVQQVKDAKLIPANVEIIDDIWVKPAEKVGHSHPAVVEETVEQKSAPVFQEEIKRAPKKRKEVVEQ